MKKNHFYIKICFSVLFLAFLSFVQVRLTDVIRKQRENHCMTAMALKKEEKTIQKYAYLTFDDGPSENTDEILDILKEKDAKATFFVIGKEGERARKRYQRIVEEGHGLGMHSYSHEYSDIYQSLANFKKDLLKLQNYLYEVTGVWTKIYRFPGGSSNQVSDIPMTDCIRYLNERGITYFDWNASSEDAVTVNATCEKLNRNILKDALRFQNPVILMHDLYECDETVAGLGELIDTLRKEGYEFKVLTSDTSPVQHVKSDAESLATMGNK